MDRLLAILSVSLLVALAPAAHGQGFAAPAPTLGAPNGVVLGPGVPCLTPIPGAYDPNGLPPGSVSTIQPAAAVVPHCPPGDPMVFDQRGVSELAAGEYEQAIADFDEALRRDPTNSDFYFHRALADFRSEKTDVFNNFERALGDLFQAILRDPHKTDLYLARARVFARMHHFDQARGDYKTVLRYDPANADAFKEREELKIRALAYNPPAAPAGKKKAATPKPTPLAKAQEQAAIEEVIARQEKAKLDAATYRYQRANIAQSVANAVKAAPTTPAGGTTPATDTKSPTTTTPTTTTTVTTTGAAPNVTIAPAVAGAANAPAAAPAPAK